MPKRQKVYTIKELLGLQDQQISDAVNTMAANPEIADIVRTQGRVSGAVPGRVCKPAETKSTSKKTDSSTSSDEVLYKGNATRRNMRATTRESIRESGGESSREPLHGTVRASARDPVRGPASDPVRSSAPEPTLDPSQQAQREVALDESSREGISSDQWQYRGRSESEVASGEPAPAPAGIPAQQHAGFQRFVQAVVSPTHIRVTAGGKIVPNTRPHPSPTSKRLIDTITTTDANVSGIPEKATHVKTPVAQGPIQQPPHVSLPTPASLLPQYMASYPPGYQPHFPYVSVYPQMAPGFTFSQNPDDAPAMAQAASGSTLKDMHNAKPGESRNENGPTTDRQEKVKITPPQYFDYTKPFIYNGQYIMPMAATPVQFSPGLGAPVMPVHMVNMPPGMTPVITPGMTPQPVGQFLQPTAPVLQPLRSTSVGPAPSINTSPYSAQGHHTPNGSTIATHNNTVNTSAKPITAAPITSIKPSEITKKQLNNFKTSLRYHEDQLQFNRHQIDEKDMEAKIQTLQAHIREFEAKLKIQLEHEAKVLGIADQKKEEEPAPSHVAEETKISPSATTVKHIPTSDTIWGSSAPVWADYHPKFDHRTAETGWPMDKDGKPQPYFCDEDFSQQLFKGQKGWPNDAVGAPAFKPGAPILSQGSRMDFGPKGRAEKAVETGGSVRSRIAPPRSKSRSRTDAKFGVPYLLGALPEDKDNRTASDEDYVYSRELTEEEQRSRFLYWGKCPKEVLKGLPKYDGRHFYPPSPVKENTPNPAQSPPPLRVPTGRQETDCAVRGTKSEHDPFRPLTPVQKFGSSKQFMVSEDGWHAVRQVDHNQRSEFCYSESSDTMVDLGTSQNQSHAASGAREGIADVAGLNVQDRRPGGSNGARLWPAMLKKAPTSSAVSSTTAQGYLPQFSGHAAASLSPSMNKTLISPIREVSPSKASVNLNDRSDGGVLLTPALEVRRENFPLHGVSSLEDQFKNISVGSSDRRDAMPGHFKL